MQKNISSLITKPIAAADSWELPIIGGKIKYKSPSTEELEQLHRQAYKKGFNKGRDDGLASGKREILQQADYLKSVIHNMESPLEALDEQLSHEVAELSIAIARQIIRRELHQDQGQIVAIAKDALGQLPGSANKISVTLHPEDAALLRDVLPESGEQTYQIIENTATQRGGCMVEASNSRVDATVDQQISHVVAALFGDERLTGINGLDELDSEAEHAAEPEAP